MVAPDVRGIAQEAREGKGATPTSELGPKEKSDLHLRELYANVLLIALAAQLAVADAVFILYAWLGVDWNISQPIIGAWLGAAVVQVIGVVLVVTRSLFPPRK